MIDPVLLEQYNAGIERARDAYWLATSPVAEYERKARLSARQRRNKQRSRTKKEAQRGRAA